MNKPIRIQRKRTKGWSMPENTVYVGRGSRWGNPFYVGKPNVKQGTFYACNTNDEAILKYKQFVSVGIISNNVLGNDDYSLIPEIKQDLRGKNLACWCALDQPCHADVLLEIANDQRI